MIGVYVYINWIKTLLISLHTRLFQLTCCGSEGPTDWVDSYFNGADREGFKEIGVGVIADSGEYKVPDSCCVKPGCDTKLNVAQTVIPGSIHTEVRLR